VIAWQAVRSDNGRQDDVSGRAPGRWRCPECGRTNSPRDRVCGGCGYDDEAEPQDHEAYPQQADLRVEVEGGTARKILKQLLGVWTVGYPILVFLPIFSTSGSGAGGAVVGGIGSFIIAGALFGPWIIGLIVLGVLVLVSPAPTQVVRHGPPSQTGWHPLPSKNGGPLEWDGEMHEWVRAAPSEGGPVKWAKRLASYVADWRLHPVAASAVVLAGVLLVWGIAAVVFRAR
jgi:hypothetical protein